MAGSLPVLALVAVSFSPQGPDVDLLIRQVVAAQRRAERALPAYTYDLVSVERSYAKNGRPKDEEMRLWAVTSEGGGAETTRELMAVNGRVATAEEKRDAAEEDAKARRRRLDRRVGAEAANAPRVGDDENDPPVGPRRLSDLLAFYDYGLEGEEVIEGRPSYVLSFRPRAGARTATLGDRALASLEGRVVIDADDLQVRSATARLVKPVKVVGGLAANVGEAEVRFEAQRVAEGAWVPCRIDLRMKGKTALVFRFDKGWDYRMDGFRRFSVTTESAVAPAAR